MSDGISIEEEVRALYNRLLHSWNKNNSVEFSGLFQQDGNVVGFDGSQLDGLDQIKEELERIFSSHKVSTFIGIVREVRRLDDNIFVLRAIAGMYTPGENKINGKVNAIQTLVAVKKEGELRIAIFQNTPAAFHERPELVKQMTQELQKALKKKL